MNQQRRGFLGTVVGVLTGLLFPERKGEATTTAWGIPAKLSKGPFKFVYRRVQVEDDNDWPYFYDWTDGTTSDPRFKEYLPYGVVNRVYFNDEDVSHWYIQKLLTGNPGSITYVFRTPEGKFIIKNEEVKKVTVVGKVKYEYKPELANPLVYSALPFSQGKV